MSVDACAAAVHRGDPDRFRATMTLPVVQRAPLLVLYAFNLEIARAPWVTQEPLIAQMRLQWWRDVLDEVYAGGPVRAHEVATPLAEMLRERAVPRPPLDAMIAARAREIDDTPAATDADLWAYLDDSAGGLLAASSAALGAPAPVPGYGRALGLARYWEAVPALRAAGKTALPDTGSDLVTIARLSAQALAGVPTGRAAKTLVPALRLGWLARPMLRAAQRQPERVLEGTLRPAPITAQARLAWVSLTGTW